MELIKTDGGRRRDSEGNGRDKQHEAPRVTLAKQGRGVCVGVRGVVDQSGCALGKRPGKKPVHYFIHVFVMNPDTY